jgi:hypothetical protein
MNSDCVLVDFQVLFSCGGCFETIGIKRVVGVFYWCSCSQFFYEKNVVGDTPGLLCLWSLVLGFLPCSKMGSLCLLPVGFCGHSACMLRLLVFVANTPAHSPDSMSINVEYCVVSKFFVLFLGQTLRLSAHFLLPPTVHCCIEPYALS